MKRCVVASRSQFSTGSKVGEIYGRRIMRGTPKHERHWYLRVHTLAYGTRKRSKPPKKSFCAKAIIDALTFWIAGYRNVTYAYGNQGFTDELYQAFIKSEIETSVGSLGTTTTRATRSVGNLREKLWRRESSACGSYYPGNDQRRQRIRDESQRRQRNCSWLALNAHPTKQNGSAQGHRRNEATSFRKM